MNLQLTRIGTALRNRRIALGHTQEDLSALTGIDRTRLSAIERGIPGRSTLLTEVADALGMDLLALPREDRRAASFRHEVAETDPRRRVNKREPR